MTASPKQGPRRAPRPLKLRKHLDTCTVAELEEFQQFWRPHQKNGGLKRDALVEKLFRVMSDENVVYAKVELLSEKVRAVLLALLKSSHYTSDLQGIFRTEDPLDLEYYEAEAALTALSRRGFVRVRRAKDWLHFGRNTYAIPLETAAVMQGLAGTDRRALEEIFVRASYKPSSFEENAQMVPAEVPEEIGPVAEALKSKKLQEIAGTVLKEYGGIVTRHEFVTSLKERKLHWTSNRFLKEFGAAGLGTVGHIDLRSYDLGVDDDALVFFHEVVEKHLIEWRARPLDHDGVLTAHGDLMTDVGSALRMVREMPVRVGKGGSVYKAARGRIAERFVFPKQPLIDRTDLADRVLAIVLGLGLAVDEGEGTLAVTDAGREWECRPLREKVRAAFDVLAAERQATLRTRHLNRVRELFLALLTDPDFREGWFPGASLAMVARNRYLLELTAGEDETPSATLSISQVALTELARAAEEQLLRIFYPLGLIDVAVRDGRSVGIRLSTLGRRVLLGEETEVPSGKRPLIVNPDFELLVLPEGEVDEFLHELDRIAERVKSGEVLHYRLDRHKVERATVDGATADEIIDLLARHSRAALPQNVEYSIRSWAGDVRSGSLDQGVLFTASDAKVIEAVLAHPLLRDCVHRQVDEKTLFFNGKILEKQIEQELRALGVYVV